MKRVVWKYVIDEFEPVASMPANARILAVAWQWGGIALWAEILLDVDVPALRPRRFQVIATGERFEPAALDGDGRTLYVGSAISDELVFHVYEVPE